MNSATLATFHSTTTGEFIPVSRSGQHGGSTSPRPGAWSAKLAAASLVTRATSTPGQRAAASTFSVCWFSLVSGGWRAYYRALVEQWTGYPSPLDEAVQAGRARLLEPGE